MPRRTVQLPGAGNCSCCPSSPCEQAHLCSSVCLVTSLVGQRDLSREQDQGAAASHKDGGFGLLATPVNPEFSQTSAFPEPTFILIYLVCKCPFLGQKKHGGGRRAGSQSADLGLRPPPPGRVAPEQGSGFLGPTTVVPSGV